MKKFNSTNNQSVTQQVENSSLQGHLLWQNYCWPGPVSDLKNDSQFLIYDASGVIKRSINIKETIRMIEQTAPKNIALFSEYNFDMQLLKSQDLMLISLDSWSTAIGNRSKWLSEAPSILVIKP